MTNLTLERRCEEYKIMVLSLPTVVCDKATFCRVITISASLFAPGEALYKVRFLGQFPSQPRRVISVLCHCTGHAFKYGLEFSCLLQLSNEIIKATKYCRMQLLVKPFNTIHQLFLVIFLYSSKALIFRETTVHVSAFKSILPFYLPIPSVPNTVLEPVVNCHCLTAAPSPKS